MNTVDCLSWLSTVFPFMRSVVRLSVKIISEKFFYSCLTLLMSEKEFSTTYVHLRKLLK